MTQTSTVVDCNSSPEILVTADSCGRLHESDAVTILCYEKEIPTFVEAELERLYENLYSSIPQMRISGKLNEASTYVVRKGSEVVTVFLFRIDRRRVEVLNEVIRIDEEDINRFAAYIFATFRSVSVVTFRAIQMNHGPISFLSQRFEYLEDIVVDLPGRSEDYTANLGKSTRRNMRRYLKALKQDFPSFKFSVFEKGSIEAQNFRDIIELNRLRMSAKGKVSAYGEEETGRLAHLARECGLVGVATIDNRVCAGAISYRVRGNYFLAVLAHDSAYDEFGLGMLCCFLIICECIKRGGKVFHFLWGQYAYKYQLLGSERKLDFLAVYRSRAHYLLNADFAFRTACKGFLRRAKNWLHQGTHLSVLANRILITLRGLRR